MERTFMTNPLILTQNNTKKKLTTGKDEDYTTGCFLDYDCSNNHLDYQQSF